MIIPAFRYLRMMYFLVECKQYEIKLYAKNFLGQMFSCLNYRHANILLYWHVICGVLRVCSSREDNTARCYSEARSSLADVGWVYLRNRSFFYRYNRNHKKERLLYSCVSIQYNGILYATLVSRRNLISTLNKF